MFKFTPLILASIILFGCGSSNSSTLNKSENALTEKEKSDGWQLLFDGKTTNGWHTYGKASVGKAWKIQDGALFLDAENKKNLSDDENGDLVTNEAFENFNLKLDWKISPKGNSGIIFYVHEDTSKYPATYSTGLEMQVLDNGTPVVPGHPDGKIYSHRAGDLYDLLAAKEMANPQGEWNQVEIKSLNGQLDFYMNGQHALSINLWDAHWTQMVAISKFKDMPGFGIFKKGKIALQDHGDDVWYRNIRIKKL